MVWREEQQGEYGSSGDAPDYGPRGCQKVEPACYMYGKQRILYPLKRVERGVKESGKGSHGNKPCWRLLINL